MPPQRQCSDHRVIGGYLHGIFAGDASCSHWLSQVGAEAAGIDFVVRTEAALDDLAEHRETDLDLDAALERKP